MPWSIPFRHTERPAATRRTPDGARGDSRPRHRNAVGLRHGPASSKLPERLQVVDQLPRNPVGKLLKRELGSHAVSEVPS